MPCCCLTTFDLCTVPACDSEGIKLSGLFAEQQGTYKLKVSFLDTDYTLNKFFEIDDPIIFSTEKLNEYQQYKAKLYAPDGTLVMYEESECIQFRVKPVFELELISEGSPGAQTY